MQNYDLVIVGAGTGGVGAAVHAASNGLSVALIENNQLGGQAIHTGNPEVKLMQRHAKITYEVQKASQWGFEIAEFTLDYQRLKNKMFSIMSEKRRKLQEQLTKYDIQLLVGRATLSEQGHIFVNELQVSAENILLATGTKPVIPTIVGLETTPFITAPEIFSLEELPKTMTIIGGSMTAVEVAFSLAPLGTEITIIEYEEDILLNEDSDLRFSLKRQLAKLNVIMLTAQKHMKLHSNYVEIESGKIAFEKLLIACGRQADFTYIDYASLEMEGGVMKVNDYFQSNIPHIYSLTNEQQLAISPKASTYRAKQVVNHILRCKEDGAPPIFIRSLNVIPSAASFGLNEVQAKQQYGENVEVLYLTIQNASDRLIIGESNYLLKIIVEKEFNEIVGAITIGDQANEVIEKIAIIVQMEGSLEEVLTYIQQDFTYSIQQRKNV